MTDPLNEKEGEKMTTKVFKTSQLQNLALNRKEEGFEIVREVERPDRGEKVTEMVFKHEGKLYRTFYKDVYWRTHNVAIVGSRMGSVSCMEVKEVVETEQVVKYVDV
ncbi:TPA: hypothetical protein NJ626_000264 [Vibrio parahaemolyticus]|uniref:hypothetical protein n=1 Tax=Vibrio parahaemolyticus TaxID=670 RepID=UPI00301BA808|nr:hypothetical protein [Vibrio parahaemolyticus]HCM1516437.1 hypothetical protein [Vibrio parahaemolyticus]